MANKNHDMSHPFPNPSSAVPMMFDPKTNMRQIYTDERQVFSVFVPFDFKDKKGAYKQDPYAFDEMMDPSKESIPFWLTLQYMITLINQNVGTPYLKYSAIMNPDLKPTDFQKILKNHKNFEDSNNTFRATYFNHTVAERVAQIQNVSLPDPSFRDKNTSLVTDELVYEAYDRKGSDLYSLNMKLGGYYSTDKRAKFDIIFMPLYLHPEKEEYEEREIFGFMAIFILYDPLWEMSDAVHTFVHDYNVWLLNQNKSQNVEFTSDPRILEAFGKDSYTSYYANHFKNYIQIDADLVEEAKLIGVELSKATSDMNLAKILQYRLALQHAAKYLGAYATKDWYKTYLSVIDEKKGWLSFQKHHDAFIYDYHTFIWNSKNQLQVARQESSNAAGRGIFWEYMPWISHYKRMLSDELVGFERIHMSLLADPDAMDIDTTENANQIYTDFYNNIMSINTNKEDSFVHSEHNSLVAIAERARTDLQGCYTDIEKYRTNHPEMETLLFPKHKDGLKSLSTEEVETLNHHLEELETFNGKLRKIRQRLLRFAVKRIFTLATTKPLTPSILATIQYIHGKSLKTSLPGDNQTTLDVNDAIPLEKRNFSQYQLKMIDENLDITAHGAMYFVTSTRYFGYNAFCTFDTYKLQVGLLDAFRTEFNMHWNYGSFGPFGTSKSRALEVFKSYCIPNVVTTVTTQSAQANASSKDMSDRIRVMDESSALLMTNSKTGGSYSPEAAAIKSELTTGYSSRHILDPGKNYQERTTRNIISIQIGCIAACSNILISDLALMSRLHSTITENESDRLKVKRMASAGPKVNTPEAILERQNTERNRVGLSDMILHTPSDLTKKTDKFFTEMMQIQQCIGILVWKLIQMGILRRPSTHIVCVVAIICKYLKTTMSISVPVRTVQRIILFAMSLSVITTINTLFNVPGLHTDLHDIPFKIEMLMNSAPYLYCTLQMVLLSFSMNSCEFLRHTDNMILEGIVDQLKIKTFPTQRINSLFKYRNIERMKQDNPLYATINTIDKSDLSLVEKDPLWPSFRDLDTVPLEFLYVEKNNNNPLTPFWRTTMTPGATPVNTNKPKKINAAILLNPTGGGQPLVPAAEEQEEDEASDTTTLIDLNYWSLGVTRAQLVDQLSRHFKDRINGDQINSSLSEIETTKIRVRTSLPLSKKALKVYQKSFNKAKEEGGELPLLERVEREMNCIELDNNHLICICSFMFGEILNRPGNNHVIIQAIKSFMYKGLKPRTLLTGSELSDNYDIEFNMHALREPEIKASSEEYLRITDPSLINASMENQNKTLVEKITKNMRELASSRDKIVNAVFSNIDKIQDKKARQNQLRNGNIVMQQMEIQSVDKAIDSIPNSEFSELTEQSPERVEVLSNENSNHSFASVLKKNESYHSHQRIYIDIDEWAFLNNALDNAIPLRVDPKTRTYQFKNMASPNPEWETIRTPLQLIELHKQSQHTKFTETTISEQIPDANSNISFAEFLKTTTRSATANIAHKRKAVDILSHPAPKKSRKQIKAAMTTFAGTLNNPNNTDQ